MVEEGAGSSGEFGSRVWGTLCGKLLPRPEAAAHQTGVVDHLGWCTVVGLRPLIDKAPNQATHPIYEQSQHEGTELIRVPPMDYRRTYRHKVPLKQQLPEP